MRYTLYRFASYPPQQAPVGMNELLAIRTLTYPPAKAMEHLCRQRVGQVPLEKMRTFNTQQPVTHLGLYDMDADHLVYVKEIHRG